MTEQTYFQELIAKLKQQHNLTAKAFNDAERSGCVIQLDAEHLSLVASKEANDTIRVAMCVDKAGFNTYGWLHAKKTPIQKYLATPLHWHWYSDTEGGEVYTDRSAKQWDNADQVRLYQKWHIWKLTEFIEVFLSFVPAPADFKASL